MALAERPLQFSTSPIRLFLAACDDGGNAQLSVPPTLDTEEALFPPAVPGLFGRESNGYTTASISLGSISSSTIGFSEDVSIGGVAVLGRDQGLLVIMSCGAVIAGTLTMVSFPTSDQFAGENDWMKQYDSDVPSI